MSKKNSNYLVSELYKRLDAIGALYTTPETDKQLADAVLQPSGLHIYVCKTPREASFLIPVTEQKAVALIGLHGVKAFIAALSGGEAEEYEFEEVL